MIWTILYWFLLVLAVAVGLRAWFWDRAGFRGRPEQRCKKCWYDLTAAPGDVAKEAIRCPECGKEHKTKRSMRKTRRSRRWILAALVLWMGGYWASVTPKIQKHGWGAAVPRVLVVASFPFLSEAQGSGLDAFILRPAASNSNRLDRYVRNQVPGANGYIWSTYADPKIAEFGWLSRRLAFLLARMENPDVLTDGTTAKGSAYKGLLGGLVREEKCYAFESDWADQIVTIDVQIQHSFGPGEHPIGWVRMRRLLLNHYRVSFGNSGLPHSGSAPSSWRVNGPGPSAGSIEGERGYWVGRFLWDSLQPVDQAYGDRREALIPGTTLTVGQDMGNGRAKSTVIFRFSEYIGIDSQGFSNDSLWKKTFHIQEEVEYRLDPNRTIAGDSSPKLKADIERSFSVHLAVEYESQKNEWVPVVIFKHTDGATGLDTDLVFGGQATLFAINPYSAQGNETEYFRGLSQNWWSWSNEIYTDVPMRENHTGDTVWRRVGHNQQSLRTRSQASYSLPGEMTPNRWSLKRDVSSNSQVKLRLSNSQVGTYFDYGGLWGRRVYEGDLEFDIPNWTVEDLRQFIVNGIVPDHAMP